MTQTLKLWPNYKKNANNVHACGKEIDTKVKLILVCKILSAISLI